MLSENFLCPEGLVTRGVVFQVRRLIAPAHYDRRQAVFENTSVIFQGGSCR